MIPMENYKNKYVAYKLATLVEGNPNAPGIK